MNTEQWSEELLLKLYADVLLQEIRELNLHIDILEQQNEDLELELEEERERVPAGRRRKRS